MVLQAKGIIVYIQHCHILHGRSLLLRFSSIYRSKEYCPSKGAEQVPYLIYVVKIHTGKILSTEKGV